MLPIEELEKIVYTNNVVKMYQELNTEIVKDIIKRLKENGDISSYTKAQMRQLIKTGGKETFIEALKKTNGLSAERKQELTNLFYEIGQKDIESYTELYKYRNKELKLSDSQRKLLEHNINSTNKELKNFTKTIAFSSQNEFVNAVDKMYLEVATGGIDFQTAFKKTTNDLAQKGIVLTTKKKGKSVEKSIEAVVRQNIQYSLREAVRGINKSVGDELGCDGVQINISPNCRPEHRVINGQKFRVDSKKWQDNKDLLEDYGCQHYETPIIYDIEKNIYTNKQIRRANFREIDYNGEKIPYYEATQKQRALERNVRNAKKAYASKPTKENKIKVTNAQSKVRKYCNETGLERQYDREYFAEYNK